MNQMTIRSIPPAVEKRLRSFAKRNRTSINTAAVSALAAGVGIGCGRPHKKRDLSSMAGTWNEAQAYEFERNTKIFRGIDDEVWR